MDRAHQIIYVGGAVLEAVLSAYNGQLARFVPEPYTWVIPGAQAFIFACSILLPNLSHAKDVAQALLEGQNVTASITMAAVNIGESVGKATAAKALEVLVPPAASPVTVNVAPATAADPAPVAASSLILPPGAN